MKWLDCSTLPLPLLCKKVNYFPTHMAQCIACIEEGTVIAGVVYDHYNDLTIQAHIWIEEGKVPSRAWFGAIFDYPFNRLGVHKILGQVAENNAEAQKLDEHFGFSEEARIRDFSLDGDLILYSMTREQCRVLNSPVWNRTMDMVRRVA